MFARVHQRITFVTKGVQTTELLLIPRLLNVTKGLQMPSTSKLTSATRSTLFTANTLVQTELLHFCAPGINFQPGPRFNKY